MTTIRIRVAAILAVAAVLFLVARQARTQTTADIDAIAAHQRLWLEVTAALLAVANTPDPVALPIGTFKAAQVRLERAVIRLHDSTPPAQALQRHLALLPPVEEVTSAARAVVDAVEKKDAAGIESAKVWLDASLTALSSALRQTRAPAR